MKEDRNQKVNIEYILHFSQVKRNAKPSSRRTKYNRLMHIQLQNAIVIAAQECSDKEARRQLGPTKNCISEMVLQ